MAALAPVPAGIVASATPAVASPSPTPSSNSPAALRQEAALFADRIQQQGIALAQLDERANAEGVRLARLQVTLRSARAALTTVDRRLRTAQAVVVRQAVASYTNGGIPVYGPKDKAQPKR